MRKFVCIFGILIGLALCIYSGAFLLSSPSYYPYRDYVEEKYYGGDAYTGIQNAAAATANNVEDLSYTNARAFTDLNAFAGVLTLATGLGFMLVSTYKLAEIVSKKRKEKKALLAGNNGFSPAPAAYQPPVNNTPQVNNTAPVSGENTFFNQQ